MEFCFCGTIATILSLSILCLARQYNFLFHISLLPIVWAFLSYFSVSRCGIGKNCHHLCSSGQGKTSGDVLRCCFGVKFVCPAGDSLSCDMVVMRTGAFSVFCSEESPQTSICSSKKKKKKRFSRSRSLESSSHTIDPRRHSSSALGLSSAGVPPLSPRSRQLFDETVKIFVVSPRDVPCRWWRQLHVVRAIKYEWLPTFAVGKVSKISRWWVAEPSCCLATNCGFLPKASALLFFCLVVLATRWLLDVSLFLGLRLRPSALVYRCHWDSLTRGVRRKLCVVLLLILVWFCGWWHVPGDYRQEPTRSVDLGKHSVHTRFTWRPKLRNL